MHKTFQFFKNSAWDTFQDATVSNVWGWGVRYNSCSIFLLRKNYFPPETWWNSSFCPLSASEEGKSYRIKNCWVHMFKLAVSFPFSVLTFHQKAPFTSFILSLECSMLCFLCHRCVQSAFEFINVSVLISDWLYGECSLLPVGRQPLQSPLP